MQRGLRKKAKFISTCEEAQERGDQMKSASMKPKEVALTLVFFVLMCGGVYLLAIVAAG